jgi:pimeloyl-ACP methyl ester carboxylesterase
MVSQPQHPRATSLSDQSLGSGLSPYNGHYGGIAGIVEDAKDFTAQLGLNPEKVIAVGHSMGAIVTSELSLQFRLRGVVLIGPVNPNPGLADIFNARIATVQKRTCD